MKLKVLATGSTGNSYIIENNNGRKLILDAGIPFKKILKGIDYKLTDVDGVLITHEHKDHALCAGECISYGLNVFSCESVKNKFHTQELDANVGAWIGSFRVTPFNVPHDGTECFGYLIRFDGQMLIYVTDFQYLPFSFRNVPINHWLIECNHCTDLIDVEAAKFKHVVRGHSNLETVKTILCRDAKNSFLQTVILCHLSADGSDASRMANEITDVIDNPRANVYIAHKGLEIDLSPCPF